MEIIFKYIIDTKDPIRFPDIISVNKEKENAVFPDAFSEYEQKDIFVDYLIEDIQNIWIGRRDGPSFLYNHARVSKKILSIQI